jgi:hypothetical protein|tara:strand:- start:6152 stop:6757 length:606 start_codon:yes stop_codon:yes gene_type:complete
MIRILLASSIFRNIPIARRSCYKQKFNDGEIDVFFQRFRPFIEDNATANYAWQMRNNIKIVRESGYNYLMYVGDDIILPDNAVQVLYDSDKDVISGIHRLFKHRAGDDHINAKIIDHTGKQDSDDRYITMDDVSRLPAVFQVHQADFGCMLFSRKFCMNDGLNFDGEPNMINSIFYAGFKPYINTDVRCGHFHFGYKLLNV